MPDLDFFSLFQQATIVVKIVIGLLALMSLISWSIMLTKFFNLLSVGRKITQDLDSFAEAQDLRSAIQLMGRDQKSPTYKVALLGVTELNRLDGYKGSPESRYDVVQDNLRRSLRQGVSDQIANLGSSLSFLATCANAAPFIGLFGTVWGIMNAFHSIGDQRTAALAAVAPGISEALVATAIGLAVAIPATVAYNFFLGKLSVIEARLVNFAGAFLNRVRRELPGLDAV